MAMAAPAPGARSPLGGAGGAHLEDSNVSSPLSEVDDGDANDEEIEHMQLGGRIIDGDNSSLSGGDCHGADDGSDSGSALSDAASDVNSDVNDTEAETERLYDTPRSQRQRDVILDQFNNGQVFEHTPNALRRTARPDVKNNDNRDNALVASNQVGREGSPRNPTTTKDVSFGELGSEPQERKRKRSPMADQSESDQPLRKRTGSVVARDEGAGQDTPMNEDDTTSADPPSGHQSVGEDEAGSLSNLDTTAEGREPGRRTKETNNPVRNFSRRRGAAVDDTAREADNDARHEQADATAEDEAERPEEEPDGDAEEEAHVAAKNIEETERKDAAFKDWTHIEEMFSIFRERLYRDRLQRLEEEEQSLLADEPTHPEYLNMKKCIDDRLNKRLREINTEFDYRMKAHERRAVAQRAQIWSQFFQAVREKREQALERLNQQWYEVQSARRSAHSLPDYGLLFPKDPAQRVRNAIAYNNEVSTLAGLAKYEGFPAGPELRGASTGEEESDMSAIDVRRGRQKHAAHHHPREEYHTATFSRLGPAGEQFIKDTPWANPNHSAHKMYQQAPIQPNGPARRASQPVNAPPPADVRATLDGQTTVHVPLATSIRQSESPEMARGMLNPGAHQMKRVGNIPNLARGSKTTAA